MITRLVVTSLLFLAGTVDADDVRVMTSGAFTAALQDLAPQYERATGQKVVIGATSSIGPDSIGNRIRRGEPVDVLIMAASALDDMIKDGTAVRGSRVDLVRSSIGVAVRTGTPKPDISSVDALKRMLLSATSIAYSASVSGTYLTTELFPRLGVAEAMMPKSRRIDRERVGTVVARGEAEIGFQQISELLPVPGIELVGPLPPGAQRVTVFSAGVASTSKNPATARALIAFLSSQAAAASIRKSGLEPIDSVPSSAPAAVPDIAFDSVAGFFKLPAGMNFGEVAGVAVNSKGHVFVFTRSNSAGGPAYAPAAAQLLEFGANGEFIGEIGRGLYGWAFAHSVRVDRDDDIWAIDKGSDMIIRFDPSGRVKMVFGRRKESADHETGP